jgi:hypothetical protein
MDHASLSTPFLETKPFASVELNFSEAKVGRCHFDALVVCNELESMFQRKISGRTQTDGFISRCGPDVRLFFLFTDVHV